MSNISLSDDKALSKTLKSAIEAANATLDLEINIPDSEIETIIKAIIDELPISELTNQQIVDGIENASEQLQEIEPSTSKLADDLIDLEKGSESKAGTPEIKRETVAFPETPKADLGEIISKTEEPQLPPEAFGQNLDATQQAEMAKLIKREQRRYRRSNQQFSPSLTRGTIRYDSSKKESHASSRDSSEHQRGGILSRQRGTNYNTETGNISPENVSASVQSRTRSKAAARAFSSKSASPVSPSKPRAFPDTTTIQMDAATPPDSTQSSPASSENLAPQQQPGAAQLMRKMQNRAARKTTPRTRTTETMSTGESRQTIGEPLPLRTPTHTAQEAPESEEVAPEAEDAAQQQLESIRKDARKRGNIQAKGSQTKALQRAASKHRMTVTTNKAKMPLLLSVLSVALLKDLLDILGELFSFGIWSWFDWTLDATLGLAAYLLGIEKDSKDRMIGWAFVGIEMIPYAGLLPAWTLRVLKAMYQSWKKIGASQRSLDRIQKKIQALQTKKSA